MENLKNERVFKNEIKILEKMIINMKNFRESEDYLEVENAYLEIGTLKKDLDELMIEFE